MRLLSTIYPLVWVFMATLTSFWTFSADEKALALKQDQAVSNAFNEQTWELKKHNERTNIKVYLQKGLNSRIKAFKVITDVNASIPSIIALLRDEKNMPKWMEGVSKTKILRQTKDETFQHLFMSMPHPIQNRDFIVQTNYTKNPDTGTVTLSGKTAPDYIDDMDGIIRMPYSIQWVLTPLPNGKTQIEFMGRGGLGGFVPAWAINYLFDSFPYFTVKNMVEMLKKDTYLDTKNYQQWAKEPLIKSG